MDNRTLEEVRKNETKLIEEIKSLEKQLKYLRSGEYYNQLRFENEMLQQVVDTNGVPSEVYDYIDCTHRITELLEENQLLKKKNQELKDRDLIIAAELTKLQDENKILKENAENNDKVVDKVNWENMLLKKQLEEYKATNKILSHELTKDKVLQQDCLTTCCGIPIGEIPKLITQQKEFIKYLEDEIDRLEKTEFYIDSIQKAAIETHKHDLSKYKEIIGE